MKEMAKVLKANKFDDPQGWENWGQESEEFVYMTRSTSPTPEQE
jgi:hypothetical protein